MSIEQFRKLVQCPDAPVELPPRDGFDVLEEEHGVQFPTEFRAFISAYGSGKLAGFYSIFNPFSLNRYISFFTAADDCLSADRQLREAYPEEFPYPLYPEDGGLLPFAIDDNGNTYYWLTTGDAEGWSVVQNEVRGSGFAHHETTFAGFLIGIIQGDIEPLCGGGLPESLFEPYALPWADNLLCQDV